MVLIGLADSTFACLAFLEDETCKLYEVMVEKAEELQTSLLLDLILQETRKHRELLNHLSKVFEHGPLAPTDAGCERQLGQLFTQALAIVRSVKDEVLKGTPVAEAAGKLVDFERSVERRIPHRTARGGCSECRDQLSSPDRRTIRRKRETFGSVESAFPKRENAGSLLTWL